MPAVFAHLRLRNLQTHWSFPLCASRDGSSLSLSRPLRSSQFGCSWGTGSLRAAAFAAVATVSIVVTLIANHNPWETSPSPRYARGAHCASKPRSRLHNRNCGLDERSKLAAIGLRRRGRHCRTLCEQRMDRHLAPPAHEQGTSRGDSCNDQETLP